MLTPESLAASDFEGWVAWIDGTPLFERVPHNPTLLGLVAGARETATRRADRATLEWRDVPADRVDRFELYFGREHWPDQPVIRIDREPGHHALRFVQMKMGGLVVGADVEQGRLGLVGYRVGYWDPLRRVCEMYEYRRNGTSRRTIVATTDPFAPRPAGLGLARETVGKED